MSARRDAILREMGLAPIWRLREAAGAAEPRPAAVVRPVAGVHVAPQSPATPQVAGDERGRRIARMDWDELASAVAQCRACRLCEKRKQAVLGVGDVAAQWLFVGEGPGADEDEKGEPFVGQAGKLLDNMLAAIGLQRGRGVYIANVVKCRPPGNRTPEAAETAACFPFLERQIALIAPKLIVALGRPAAQTLLDAQVKIASVRGRLFDFRGTPLIVMYHPAYLLRNLPDKAKAWEDLCFARSQMRRIAERGEPAPVGG